MVFVIVAIKIVQYLHTALSNHLIVYDEKWEGKQSEFILYIHL
jgi:hypothetical protein